MNEDLRALVALLAELAVDDYLREGSAEAGGKGNEDDDAQRQLDAAEAG